MRPPGAIMPAIVGILALLLTPAPGAACPDEPCIGDVGSQVDEQVWHLYAVEYARSGALPERRLVRGAPAGARVEMSWYFFVAVGHGHVVLIDTGTDALDPGADAQLRASWAIDRAPGVEAALGRLGLSPPEVTDVVLTHHHWDHVGGLPHFPSATVHAQAMEWRRIPARVRLPVERSGRLRTFTDSPHRILPGIILVESGRHTGHHLMVRVACRSAPIILAGDAAYLYRNIEEHLPVTVTTDGARNVADVAEAVREVGAAHVVPGHDPALFERHPSGVEGVATICH